jgi:mitochondrial import inner membrane translocase subunit TIM21
MLPIPRVLPLLKLPSSLRPLVAARWYATPTGLGTTNAPPTRKRKAVTMLNDDGRVAWEDLSAREKAARTTQQTFNFGMIILGTLLTV